MKWVSLLAAVCFVPTEQSLFSSISYYLNYEICDDNFITPNLSQLRTDLKQMLFGQHIIIDKIIPILDSHFNQTPKKALVICMHGWTGSGKNYATKIIVDALFRKKVDSKFVHQFNGRLHFPRDDKEYVERYKFDLMQWVKGNVTNCPRSLFIFDEVDKMPNGVIDGIKPFFDYYEKIDGVDFRKSIFIFISNIGAELINSQYMELWRSGKSRADMEYKDYERDLRFILYKTYGAFQDSAILEGHLVSLYLPFLPLGMEEVRKCVKAEMERQNVAISEDRVDFVLNEMEFNSDGFSTSGCKRVFDLVAAVKHKYRDDL